MEKLRRVFAAGIHRPYWHIGVHSPSVTEIGDRKYRDPGPWNRARFICLHGAAARRKPRLLLRLSGLFLFRLADRQFLALLFQLPPRITRFTPQDPDRITLPNITRMAKSKK